MKLQLKNIKYFASMSEETNAYTATVYIDGRKAIDVKNDGHGGCDYQHPCKGFNHTHVAEADKWCAENLPPMELDLGNRIEKMPETLESWCASQVTEFLQMRDMKRSLRGKVLMVLDGTLQALRWKGRRVITPDHIEAARRQYPEATILNDLPQEAAFKLYLAHG